MDIRVAHYYWPPYHNLCPISLIHKPEDHQCDPGWDTALIYSKLTAIGFRVQFINTANVEEMFEMVRNHSADITGVSWPLTLNRFVEFQSTSTTVDDQLVFLVKSVQKQRRNLFFSMCHWSVWLLLCVTLISVVVFKKILRNMQSIKKDPNRFHYLQDVPYATWFWVFEIIFYTYTSLLAIIFSTNTPDTTHFKSVYHLIDKVAHGECTLFRNSSLTGQDMSELPADTNYYYNKLTPYVNTLNENTPINLKILEDGCNVAMVYKSELANYQALSCFIDTVQFPQFPLYPNVYYYRRDFQFKSQIIKVDWTPDWKERHMTTFRDTSLEKKDCVKSFGLKALNIEQLADCFSMLLIASAIGVAVLLWQNFIKLQQVKAVILYWSEYSKSAK